MEAGLLGDHDAVDIDDSIAGLVQHGDRSLEHAETRSILELRIVGRKVRADVTQAGCAEERVDHRVSQHVSVGVAVQPGRVLYAHAAKHQRTPRHERVDVVSDADPHRPTVSCSRISASTTSRSSGVVSLMLAGSPGTTVTV